MNQIIHGDNLDVLKIFPNKCVDLIYIDPPFNTGKKKEMERTVVNTHNKPVVFSECTVSPNVAARKMSFDDNIDDYLEFLYDRVAESYRLLKDNGSFFFHIDYREGHYCKCMLDKIFGRECFMNEIIWSYEWGAKSRKKWSTKHDNIFWYVKNKKNYTFNYKEVDRVPYLAPSLVGPEKAKRGKTLCSVWWNSIVPTNGKERTGYPTQKPLAILDRIVRVHTKPGDVVMDYFAGSGSMGEAAAKNGRSFILIDSNADAIKVMEQRLGSFL